MMSPTSSSTTFPPSSSSSSSPSPSASSSSKLIRQVDHEPPRLQPININCRDVSVSSGSEAAFAYSHSSSSSPSISASTSASSFSGRSGSLSSSSIGQSSPASIWEGEPNDLPSSAWSPSSIGTCDDACRQKEGKIDTCSDSEPEPAPESPLASSVPDSSFLNEDSAVSLCVMMNVLRFSTTSLSDQVKSEVSPPAVLSKSQKKRSKRKKSLAKKVAYRTIPIPDSFGRRGPRYYAALHEAEVNTHASVQPLMMEPHMATMVQRKKWTTQWLGMFVTNSTKVCPHVMPLDDSETFDKKKALPSHYWLRGWKERIMKYDNWPDVFVYDRITNWRDMMSDLAQLGCFDIVSAFEHSTKLATPALAPSPPKRKSTVLAEHRKKHGHGHGHRHRHGQGRSNGYGYGHGSQDRHSDSDPPEWDKMLRTYVPYDPLRDPLTEDRLQGPFYQYQYSEQRLRTAADFEFEVSPMTVWRFLVLQENGFFGIIDTALDDVVPRLSETHGNCALTKCRIYRAMLSDSKLDGDLKEVPFKIWLDPSFLGGVEHRLGDIMPAFNLVYPLHVFQDEITESYFVCAEEFVREFSARWFTRITDRMHGLYTLNHPYGRGSSKGSDDFWAILEESAWKRWIDCPQALIGDKSDPEEIQHRLWLVDGRAEVLIDSKCEAKEGTTDPDISPGYKDKGKGKV